MVDRKKIQAEQDRRQIVYGALDLGTNNCRLLLAVPQGDGFKVVDAFSRMTRLGEGLAVSGVLAPAAIARTLAALKSCAEKLQRRQVVRLRSVATEACRRAGNCADFLGRVVSETGLDLEIITAQEEAHLALAGCAPLLMPTPPDALVFDIGGGSTELIDVRLDNAGRAVIGATQSLPLGVVTMADEYGDDLHDPAGYERVVDHAMRLFRRIDEDGRLSALAAAGKLQMLGTSGTVTTLAGIHLDLVRYDRSQVDGLHMDFTAIDAISQRLMRSSFDQRAAHPCIGPERADLVVAGCAILSAICRLWPVGRLRVADRGVREGLLLGMMLADRKGIPA
jgi:exopolyphosphatase/guanosine-5'-triphosphate,3'-diphosphate pyrophosphatase